MIDKDRGEANAQLNVPRSLVVDADVVDADVADVRLTTATSPGATFDAPFDHDLDGDLRGAAGVVDRGADERP